MNPNLFVWTSDWHIGKRVLAEMRSVSNYILSLDPAGVIDTGDCKDLHDSTDARPQLEDYVTNVLNVLPWATATGAQHPVLPGNHDEVNEDNIAGSDFSPFNEVVWGPPYHWACDWATPKVRFIGVHARIVHPQDPLLPYAGFFVIEADERAWLSDQLEGLPNEWQVIICSHPPLAPALGSNIGIWVWPTMTYGGTETQALLQAHKTKVAAYICGHRHANMVTADLDGILHIAGPGVSYSQGNGHGGFVPIDYDAEARTLTFRYHLGHAPFAPFPGYTPIVLQLPPIDLPPPPPTDHDLGIAELKLTTVGYKNKHWTTPPAGSHWRKALDLLEVE